MKWAWCNDGRVEVKQPGDGRDWIADAGFGNQVQIDGALDAASIRLSPAARFEMKRSVERDGDWAARVVVGDGALGVEWTLPPKAFDLLETIQGAATLSAAIELLAGSQGAPRDRVAGGIRGIVREALIRGAMVIA